MYNRRKEVGQWTCWSKGKANFGRNIVVPNISVGSIWYWSFHLTSNRNFQNFVILEITCKQALSMGYSEICFRIATCRGRARANLGITHTRRACLQAILENTPYKQMKSTGKSRDLSCVSLGFESDWSRAQYVTRTDWSKPVQRVL